MKNDRFGRTVALWMLFTIWFLVAIAELLF